MMHKICALLLSSCLVFSVHAAPPSNESVEALLAATGAQKLIDSVLPGMDQMMRQSMAEATKGQTLSAEQQRMLAILSGKIAQIVREELDWATMRPVYVQIYQESFSQEEVDGLIAFYKSPAGAAMVEKMPMVMQKSMALMQNRMGPLMAKMKAVMEQTLAEVKATK